MIVAIVDLGSNTIRLCLYEYSESSMRSILEKKTMAGLANYIESNKLMNEGIERACEILNEYKMILKNLHIEEKDTYIFATASLRNIDNTMDVMKKIKDNTGYDIELISGEEEAFYDFKGAIKGIKDQDGILVDIGGGSTEIIIFQNKEITYATSIPLGSLNLYVNFVKKIIPKEKEREEMKAEILRNLEQLALTSKEFKTIYGIGGSIRAIRKLINYKYNFSSDNMDVEMKHLAESLELYKNSKKVTLNPILRNIPDRIHTIIPGLIIIHTIAEYFHSEQVIVSKYGVREGYFYERILNCEID